MGHHAGFRWGVFNLQPAEVAKLSLFIFLAGYLVRQYNQVRDSFFGFIKPLVVLAILAVLLLQQPDLGSFVVMFVTTVGMLFIAGAKLWQFLAMLAAAVLGDRPADCFRTISSAQGYFVYGSVGRSLRQRLPANAVADGFRPRGLAGPRIRKLNPKA